MCEREDVRKAIERPESVLLVRLKHLSTNSELSVANVHVTWTQLNYPALQALQVTVNWLLILVYLHLLLVILLHKQ